MQKTIVPGVWMWSRWQADRSMDFNSWFVKGEPNVVVDPLEPDADDLKQIADLGGVAWVIVTNRDHERAAKTFVERFGAKVAASEADAGELSVPVSQLLRDGESLEGWRAIGLEGFKTRGEIALYSRACAAVILGDSLWGDPAGSLRFMPDEKLADPNLAALSMRRVRGVPQLDFVLVGDGVPIFADGRRILGAAIDARNITATSRLNFEDVPLADRRGPRNYRAKDGEIGFLLGAERLGYRIAHLDPGTTFCPVHWHTAEEELLIVWDGEPTVVTPGGDLKLRRGDCFAFPRGAAGAHSVRNDGPEVASVFLIANTDASDVCFYPNSKKLLVKATGDLVRSEPELDYYDGE